MRVVSFGLIVWSLAAVFAQDAFPRMCTKAEAIEAGKEIESLTSWDQVYRSFEQFSRCDDGGIAEGYSESVTKLLAEKWVSVTRLIVLTDRNRNFRSFVLRHIDETVPAERLATIARHARFDCPTKGQQLCLSIAKSAAK